MGSHNRSHTRIPSRVAGPIEDVPDPWAISCPEDIPAIVFEHVARKLGVDCAPALHPDRSLYRHRAVVLKRLGVSSWGASARALAHTTMIQTAKTRTDPADVINAAVDALIRHRFELPALVALRRLAGNVHSQVNAAQWDTVCAHLDEAQRSALEFECAARSSLLA